MKKIIISILFLVFAQSNLAANEISDIRYGVSPDYSRLVIEAAGAFNHQQLEQSDFLILELRGISQSSLEQMLSNEEQSLIKTMDWDGNLVRITFTIKSNQVDKIFTLPNSSNGYHRLIIDWQLNSQPVASDSISKTAAIMADQAVLNRHNAGSTPSSIAALKLAARNALLDQEYSKAISLLNKMYRSEQIEDKAFALEFLGVARERNGQLAFAKKYYQQFLTQFTEHQAAGRVEQRLNALIGLEELDDQKQLKTSSRTTRRVDRSFFRGSISTDYRMSDLVNDLGERNRTLSLFSVDTDFRGDTKLDSGRLKYHFSAGQYNDMEDDDDGSSQRLRYANLAWEDNDDYAITLGRQRSRGKGVFGRFDGLLFGYSVNDSQQINVVAGAPVSSSRDVSIDSERSFIGLSYDWEDLWDNVDISIFGLSQTIGDLTDRQAVGGEFRYFENNVSVFALLDYDVFHAEINAFMLSGSYQTESKTRMHWSLNQRKSPYMSTRNALIGQTADSLDELQLLFLTDDEILDLAVDRTLESNTASFQLSTPFTETIELSGSVTWMDMSGAPASGGVAEIIKPGASMYYNLYLRARNLYSQRDSSQLGVRISQLDKSDVNSFYLSSQYRWKNGVSLTAKVRYDDRQNDNGGGQESISPTFRAQYQAKKHFVYLDLGAIYYSNQIQNFDTVNTDIYYLYLGYRFYF